MVERGALRCIVAAGLTAVLGTYAMMSSAGAAGRAPAPSPQTDTAPIQGNGLVAFASDRGGDQDIYTMYLDGQGVTDITNDPGSDTEPAWSTDGSKLAFVSTRSGGADIWTSNADGSSPVNLTNTKRRPDAHPTWSPAGTIAYSTLVKTNNEILTQPSTGGPPRNVTRNPANDREPAFSPDGTKILFVSDRSGNDDIWVLTNGSHAVNLTVGDLGSDVNPAWSPDGTMITFASDKTGTYDIYVADANGTGPTDITNDPAGNDTHPVFSPDHGTRLDFTSDRDGNQEVYSTNMPGTVTLNLQADLTLDPGADTSPAWQPLAPYVPNGSPIQHVIILDQENESFDQVLGQLCIQDARCDGASTGQVDTGETIQLKTPAPDIPPVVAHGTDTVTTAVNGGTMDGFSLVPGCEASTGYACYEQYDPTQIPSMAALARQFVIADRVFATDPAASWGTHLDLAASYLDGFYQGDHHPEIPGNDGWGCDSGKVGQWRPVPSAPDTDYPTCIPDRTGFGPFRASPVPWAPTIMDRMDQAGKTWKLYTGNRTNTAYQWAMCPTFADCLYSDQTQNWTRADPNFFEDAAAGSLPNLSFVIPANASSQHNGQSMLQGDNWIASVVGAVQNGPDWNSSAIFITYDDCGCFYDHVRPPTDIPAPFGLGIREPFLIISPYAKPAYTDSTETTFNGMLAFTEHTFGLAPLSTWDRVAYDFSNSFDYSQPPLPPIRLTQHPLPEWEIRYLQTHPEPYDPTGT